VFNGDRFIGAEAPPKSIIKQPELQVYVSDFGQKDDTSLMEEMLTLLRKRGYKKASLSVQKANYAYTLYLKVGFTVWDENEEEYIMICDL